MMILMYLEPSSQLTTRTPKASLWSCAKIAFAKLVRPDYSTIEAPVLHLGKFVSPDRRPGVKSVDENRDVRKIAKSFAHSSCEQLEHRPGGSMLINVRQRN